MKNINFKTVILFPWICGIMAIKKNATKKNSIYFISGFTGTVIFYLIKYFPNIKLILITVSFSLFTSLFLYKINGNNKVFEEGNKYVKEKIESGKISLKEFKEASIHEDDGYDNLEMEEEDDVVPLFFDDEEISDKEHINDNESEAEKGTAFSIEDNDKLFFEDEGRVLNSESQEYKSILEELYEIDKINPDVSNQECLFEDLRAVNASRKESTPELYKKILELKAEAYNTVPPKQINVSLNKIKNFLTSIQMNNILYGEYERA